jgi:DNA-binding NtrC family response regulator
MLGTTVAIAATVMRKRVLVVDDTQDLLRAINRILGRYFDVVTAGGAHEALVVLETESIDVVLSDLNMAPGPNGLWLLGEVARLHPTVRRLLMSTPDPIAGLDEALADGTVQRFFEKPLEFTEVILTIGR